jgi:hypothetical protein
MRPAEFVSLTKDLRYADQATRAKAFCDIAYEMLRAARMGDAIRGLKTHENSLVQKAAAHALGDDIWEVDDAQALSAAYVESIAEGSIPDQVARYARMIGIGTRNALIASGETGDIVEEGDVKVIRRLQLSLGDVEPTKAVAAVVLTKELINRTGDAGRALFERELRESVNRAVNRSFLSKLTNSGTIAVAGTGDPLADLRAGLQAAGPSNGFVVAAPSGDVADLATRVENRGGMSVRGGEFVPGVSVVAVDDINGMHVIPASRLALWAGGLEVRSAEHATVNMADDPEGQTTLVSLFQTNSVGLIAERSWHLAQAAEIVVVGGAS